MERMIAFKRFRVFVALMMTLLLVACGSSTTPNNPNNPNTPNNPDACAVTLTENIITSTMLVNSASACDYLIAPRESYYGARTIAMTNGTLTIEPGTVIRFAEGAGLNISDNAKLQAIGTASSRIRFEGASPVRGYGLGIFLSSDSLESWVAYADFAYLGQQDSGFMSYFKYWNGALAGLEGGGLHLTNSTIMGSNYFGAYLDNLPLLEFSRNTFYDNARAGVSVTAPQVTLLDAASDYLGTNKPNGEPYLYVGGVEPVLEDTTWQPLNAPYFIAFGFDVEGATLTLEPGVHVVLGEGAGFSVGSGGTLLATGTADKPILFTGQEKVAGYWGSLTFSGASPDSRLEYTTVEYGGGGIIYEGNIFVAYQDALYIGNSTITNSGTYGICTNSEATLTQGPGNTFSDNTLDDVNTACDE